MQRGRPAFQPTDAQRRQVKAMAAYGIPHFDIAKVLECDEKTLRKHFWAELETGGIEANARVAENMFKIATGSGREAVIAGKYWLACRAGWREAATADDLGKKEQRQQAALTAEQGTPWEALLNRH